MSRWRGTLDVPPTLDGLWAARELGEKLKLDVIYYDKLSRCRRTGQAIFVDQLIRTEGPRPWKMGPLFEGKDITPKSLLEAQFLVENPTIVPDQGESFGQWCNSWTNWIQTMDAFNEGSTGIVTHNRNIQALYSFHNAIFYPHLYNVKGPAPLSVHYYYNGLIAPWNYRETPPGLYLIRHAPTNFGT